MNKDLDDRLIPNGEYRDAQNISVGKSEEDDIGALETVLGNVLMTATGLISPTLPSDMTVIGLGVVIPVTVILFNKLIGLYGLYLATDI